MAARVHSMGGSGGSAGPTLAVVAPPTAGAVPDRILTIEVATDEHPQARATAAAGLLGHLQGQARDDDDVVAADDALLLDAEDLIEVHTAEGDEGRGGIGGGPRELIATQRSRSAELSTARSAGPSCGPSKPLRARSGPAIMVRRAPGSTG